MKRAAVVAALGALLCANACRPDLARFYGKTYACDSSLGNEQCGTDVDGKPMACFATSQLGADDFCTATCSGGPAASTDTTLCLDSGAALPRCQPSVDSADIRACADPSLNCLRTSLLEDRGACTTAKVCATDADCHDPKRAMCSSTLLKQLYRSATALHTDHLTCLKYGCQAKGSDCPPAEVCLPDVVPAQSHPADICVSQCDASQNCPPNFVCYTRVSGPASPMVCIPGIMNFKCSSDTDCMIGSCIDTLAGFKVCTVPCASDADCTPFDSPRGIEVCSFVSPAGTKYCMTAETFSGAPCGRDSDCGAGNQCTFYSPYHTNLDFGICLPPCGSDRKCEARGGIPHSCLSFLDRPACYPGIFGLYCEQDGDCPAELTCRPVQEMTADDQLRDTTACTIPCASDDDCRHQPKASNGWCEGGVCQMPRPGNRLCARGPQCQTGVCAASQSLADLGKGISRCTVPAGGAP